MGDVAKFDVEVALESAVAQLQAGRCELGGDNIDSCEDCRRVLLATIREAHAAGRAEGIEVAAAVECEGCRDGIPALRGPSLGGHEGDPIHTWTDGRWCICQAEQIRALLGAAS